MSRAQSMDVVNGSTTLQSRIDTVLATPALDWANDSGWQPGDPLYEYPDFGLGGQYVRRMFDLLDLDMYDEAVRCQPCAVSWSDGDTCWNCGAECPRPSYGYVLAPGAVWFDETHEWASVDVQPLIERMESFNREMAAVTTVFDEFQQRYMTTGVDFAPVEQRAVTWLGADTGRMWLLPTVAELQQAEPLAEWERELLGLSEEPVIRFPEGAEITPVADLTALMPEHITVTGRTRRPPSPRYYFNRPVTERRRS